jgi:anti-sigma regulatory factor (Ser/Thr protein kinase)
MRFGISDLNEFIIKDKKLICTTNFVKPVHIVMMSSIHNYTNRSAIFYFQKANEYAQNMSFRTPLEINTVDGEHHSKAIKLENQFDNDSQVDKVMNIFTSNNYLDYETNDVLSIILAEIFQNFYAHARFDEPPICCVQDWSTSDYIEIAIADRGIGIDKSLEEVLQDYPQETNPCRIACDSGISCSLDKESSIGTKHSGYGLFFTKRFIEENQGHLYLISGKHCYINRPNGEFDEKLDYKWKGTVVRLIINKNKCVPSEEFFKTISREQEGEDYDEFF